MAETTTPSEATPVAAPAPAAPATKDRPSSENRKAAAVGSLREMLRARNAPTPAAEPTPAAAPASAPAPATTAKIEAAGGEAPAQKSGESEAAYELRLAKTLRELKSEKAKSEKLTKARETEGAELAKLKKLVESGKANPLEALEALGFSFKDLVDGINSDKFKPPAKKLDLPPEVAERLERFEKVEREREQERAQEVSAKTRAGHEKQVSDFLAQSAEEYPFAASLPWAASKIIDQAYAEQAGDFMPLLASLEAALTDNAAAMFGSTKSIKKLLKSKPDLKKQIMEALDLNAAPVATEETSAGSAIDGIATEPRTPGKKKTRDQLKAEAIAGLRAMKQG